MKRLKTLGIGAVMALAIPALASATVVNYASNFSGYADHTGSAPGVYSIGTSYSARLILDAVNENPWYPFAAGMEYTAVMSTGVTLYQVVADAAGPGIDWVSVDFSTASVDIYEDAGTAADFANPGTFTDGTHILSGLGVNMHAEGLTIYGMPLGVTGVVVFNGGSGYGSLLGCGGSGLSMNDFIDITFLTPPTGYEEAYDAEWKCESTVSVDDSTWGSIKSLYR